jgi:hypothetical protein
MALSFRYLEVVFSALDFRYPFFRQVVLDTGWEKTSLVSLTRNGDLMSF